MIKKRMNKRAISILIGYVLLITLAIVMSGIVYSWLKFYAQKPFAEASCRDVSLIITDYNCTYFSPFTLNLSIQNKGRFDVDGYIIKINNGTRDYNVKEKGTNLNYVNVKMESGNVSSRLFDYSALVNIAAIEIEAIRGKDKYGRNILCENSVIRQSISC